MIDSNAVEVKGRLTAVIADDEPVARRLLRHNLIRFAPHVEIVGEASNGEELLQLLDHVAADILMLDIVMPGLNGLEFLAQFEAKTKGMEVIIISAYDRFDFAQQALHLGVFDFLLKPVRPADLVACIDRCEEDISSRRNMHQSYADLKRQMADSEKVVKTSILREVVSSVSAAEQEIFSWNGLQYFDSESPQLMIVVDVINRIDNDILDIVAEWGREKEAVWCTSGEDRVVILTPKNSGLDQTDLLCGSDCWAESVVHSLNNEICTLLPKDKAGSVRIAYIEPIEGVGLGRRYEIVCNAMNRAYVTSETVVRANPQRTSVSTISGAQHQYENQIAAIELRLLAEVRSGSLEGAVVLLQEWAKRVAHLDCGYSFLRLEFAVLMNSVCKTAIEVTGESEGFLAIRNDVVERLTRVSTLTAMADIAKTCLERVFDALRNTSSFQGKVVLQAKKIIDERFDQDLTLSQVASEVFVSPYYLSRLFKQQCGIGFQDYLTAIRISEAKELLRSTDSTCAVIAERVGYSTASYFSKIFGRITGQSPTEFRKSVRQKPQVLTNPSMNSRAQELQDVPKAKA
jgi:two-component system response regulator YesN